MVVTGVLRAAAAAAVVAGVTAGTVALGHWRHVQRLVVIGGSWPYHAAANVPQVVVERLTKNINEDHLYEIFGQYGHIKDLDLPISRVCK